MRRSGFLAVGFLLLVMTAGVRIADPYPVQAIRAFYFDYLQRLHPREYADLPVRVVDIDEASLSSLGQWPWPRDQLGALVTRLVDDYGAAAVAFDVLFSEPDRLSPSLALTRPVIADLLKAPPSSEQLATLNNDTSFAAAIAGRRVILGIADSGIERSADRYDKSGFAQIGSEPAKGLLPLRAVTNIIPELRQAAEGIGGINISPFSESDVVRSVPMVWNSPIGLLPSLSLEALRVALGESTTVIVGENDASGTVLAIQLGDYEIPTTADGQIWVHYRHEDPALYVSAKSVLAPEIDAQIKNRLEGNIVLVGTSSAGLLDIRTTPLGENVPGVSIHAQILEQILTNDFLLRGDYESGLEIVAFACLSAIVVAVMSISGPVVSMIAGGASTFVVVAASWFAFRQGTLFDATFPALGGFSIFVVLAAYQFIVADREKRLIRRSFSHYVAPSVLQAIEKSGHHLELGGQMRTVTVMFCDLRNFTPLSETMSPTDLVSLLNSLFSQFSECVLQQSGTIDKFIGDSIMAFWNAPLEMAAHRKNACLTALNIRKALNTFNQPRKSQGLPELAVAIGLCSGSACVGNIGSRQRYSYSAIGDTVNVAARIEASARYLGYDVAISEETQEGIKDMASLPAGRINLKGKSDRVALYILVGDKDVAASPAFLRLQSLHERLLDHISVHGRALPADVDLCKTAAQDVEMGLIGFYDRLAERAKDFEPYEKMTNEKGTTLSLIK
jgi:adenylate cyclase